MTSLEILRSISGGFSVIYRTNREMFYAILILSLLVPMFILGLTIALSGSVYLAIISPMFWGILIFIGVFFSCLYSKAYFDTKGEGIVVGYINRGMDRVVFAAFGLIILNDWLANEINQEAVLIPVLIFGYQLFVYVRFCMCRIKARKGLVS